MFTLDLWSQLLSTKPDIYTKAEDELSGYDKKTFINYLKAFRRSVSEDEAKDFSKLKSLLLKRIRRLRDFIILANSVGKKYTANDFVAYMNWKAFSGDESKRPPYPVDPKGNVWDLIVDTDKDMKDFFKAYEKEKEERERKERKEREAKEREEREAKEKEERERKERKEREERERKEKEAKEKEERERKERKEREEKEREERERKEREEKEAREREERERKERKEKEEKEERERKERKEREEREERESKERKKKREEQRKEEKEQKQKKKEEASEAAEEEGFYQGDKLKTADALSQIKYKHPYFRGYIEQEPDDFDSVINKKCITDSKLPLRDHQKLAVNKLQNTRGLLLIHSVGSGKTLTAVTAAKCYLNKHPDREVLVVAPKSLVKNFDKELDAYGAFTKEDKTKVSVLTYDAFLKQIDSKGAESVCKKRMIIIDEAHNLRTIGGKKVKAALDCSKYADKILLLSATPVVNSPFDILVMMSYINPTIQPIITKLKSANFSYDSLTPDDYKKIFGCQVSFYDPSPEQMTEYPKANLMEKYFKMSPEYYKKYKNIEENTPDLFLDEKLKKIYASGSDITAFYNGTRRATNDLEGINGPKFKYLDQLLKQTILANDHSKLVIYTFWDDAGTKIIEEILKNNKVNYGIVSGSTSLEKRGEYVKRYNSDVIGKPTDSNPLRVLLISKAGGEGLDLHQTSDIIVFEPYWNESLMTQVVGRAIRYKSHQFLPPSHRVVNVHKLYLVKPQEHEIISKAKMVDGSLFEDKLDMLPLSADIYLKFLSSAKQKILDMFLKEVRKYSIENEYCKKLAPPF